MRLWRGFAHGLRSLLRPDEADRDVADEIRHYLAEAEAELVAGGASVQEARRAARLRYGDGLSARDAVRGYGWEITVEALLADIRFAGRRLRRRPGFTAVALLTLGLGIGSSTAIFSAVSPVLFQPLSYPEADRMVAVSDRQDDGAPVAVTFGTFRELSERSRAFDGLSVLKPWQPALAGGPEPERLDGQQVSAGYFGTLGVPPALGRGFEASADRPGGPKVVVLSDGLWRRRFGSDPAIVGREVRLSDELHVVLGVMPAGFENVTGPGAEVWSLLQYDASLPTLDGREWGHHLDLIGRLRAGVDIGAARSELDGIARLPIGEFVRPVWASLERGLLLRPLRAAATAETRPTMLAIAGAGILLLAIACVNVTILLLASGAQREGELAVRATLGAGRPRLARQLLTESLLLAGLGGAIGIVVARVGVDVLVALSPPGLPRVDSIGIDGMALGFALGVTTVVGILVGLGPALTRPRGELHDSACGAGRSPTGRHRSARRSLVVTEVALAVVLLIAAGLVLRSIQRLFAIPPGFDPARVVVLQVHTTGFEDDAATERFFDRALDAVRQTPGVRSAALTNQLPLSGDESVFGVNPEEDDSSEGEGGGAYRHTVSPGYFETMGIRLASGRGLDERDVAGAAPVVVVSEALARRLFAGRDPIGRRVHVGRTDLPAHTVVGVVSDTRHVSLEAEPAEAVYVTPAQWYFADVVRWLVVRAEGDAGALVPALRQAVWSVDGNQPIVRTQTMDALVQRSEARRRFVLIVLESFALVALMLAGVGLYGVLSGSVTERMPEIGLRAALGASRTSILGLVVRQGMTVTAIGVAIGLAGAAAASRALVALLFGVSRLDAVTYLAVVALLGSVAALACWIPAARAARADPLATLRAE